MKRIHLVMPMGGKGSRFAEHGFEFPKPLIPINGKPFFYWSTMSIAKFINVIDITFAVLQEHVERFNIDKEIRLYFPRANIKIIPDVLNGAVLTCREGLSCIHDDSPIVFNDCDHMFRCRSFEQFIDSEDSIDGALLTFKSNEEKYSFLRIDDYGNVCETVEKQAISNQAICGCYYFASKNIFISSSEQYLKECQYKEFFVSGVYNVLAREGKVVKAFQTDFHVPFGVPEEYKIAKDSPYFQELE